MFDSMSEMIRGFRRPDESKVKQYACDEQRELIRRAQAGDTIARDALVTSYVPAVASAVRVGCKRGDEREDCAQEALLRLMRAVECYEPTRGAAVSSYFFTVIERAITRFNCKRATQQSRTTRLKDSAVPESVDDADDPLVRSERRGETEKFAAELLDRANPREQQVLTNYFRGESLAAIGRRIGVTRERVRQIKETGLERIRQSVEGRGRDRREGPR